MSALTSSGHKQTNGSAKFHIHRLHQTKKSNPCDITCEFKVKDTGIHWKGSNDNNS